MRLQGGLLHVVGWRGREHLVYMRATFRGGRRCARNSLSPIPPLVEAQGRPRVVFTPSLSPHFLWQLQLAALRSVAALVAVFTRSGSPVRIKARDTSTIRENRVQPRLRLTSSRLRLTSNIWFTAVRIQFSVTTKAPRSPRPSESTPTAPRLAPSALHPLHCPGGHTPMISPHHLMHARHARRLSGTRPSSPSPPSTSSLAERSATHC